MTTVARKPDTLQRIGEAQAAAEPVLGGGPLWAGRRRAALERVLALGLPTRRDENWKYLNLRALEKRSFAPAIPALPGEADLLARLVPLEDVSRIVLVDGRLAPGLSTAGLPDGVRVTALEHAFADDPAAAAARLATPGGGPDDRFALLAEVLAGAGLLLGITGEIATPLYVVHVQTGHAGAAVHARLAIDMAPKSRAVLVEHFVSMDGAASLYNLHAEVDVAAGAALEHYRVQQLDVAAALVETLTARVAASGSYRQHGFPLGAALARTGFRLELAGPGAEGVINGLFLADGQREVDLYTLVEHVQPHTRSEQVFRGIATGAGHGAYNGKVIVHPGAQKADSSQSSRNLLLSPGAEIDARPQLEIHADDVKCSHGVTIGSLDPAQLFYLLSRGIDRATAQGLLTFAFCEDVLATVRLPALRRHLEDAVLGRLPDRDVIKEFV